MSFYVFLNSLWRRERHNTQLIELDEDFFNRTQVYLQYLENQSTSTENDELKQALFSKRLEYARFLIYDIIKLRIQKHSKAVLTNSITIPSLRYQEEDFRERLQDLIRLFKEAIFDQNKDKNGKHFDITNNKNNETAFPEQYFILLYLQFTREEQKRELLALDENFYKKISRYLQYFDTTIMKNGLGELDREILTMRSKIFKEMIWKFIELRISKHFFEKLSEEFISLESRVLPQEERIFRSKLDSLVKNFKESVFENTEFEQENETENQLIEMIKADNDEHTGPDGKFYGPFKSGDIVYVPIHLAKFLVQYAKARYLNLQ